MASQNPFKLDRGFAGVPRTAVDQYADEAGGECHEYRSLRLLSPCLWAVRTCVFSSEKDSNGFLQSEQGPNYSPITLRLLSACISSVWKILTHKHRLYLARVPPCSKFSERQGATHPLCYPIPSRERGRPAMFTKRFATSTRCLSLNRMRESKAFRCTLPALREDRLNSLCCWAERACAQ